MKTNKLKLGTLLMAGAFFALTACKKDEATTSATTSAATPLNATEASASIDSNSDELTASVTELSSSESTQAISDIFSQFDATPESTSPTQKKAFNPEPLKRFYGKEITLNGKHWDDATVDKSKVGTTNDIYIIIPKNTEHAEAKLTIKSFFLTQVQGTDGSGNIVMNEAPEKIVANLTIAGKEVASVNLAAAYNKTAKEGYPTNATATLKLDVFALNASIKESDLTNSADLSLTKNSKIIIASGASATFASNDRTDENITAASGYVQLVDMKLNGSAPDVKAIQKLDSTATAEDFNKLVIVTITKVSTGQTVATLKAKETTDVNGQTNTNVVFVFADGTVRDAEKVLTKISDKIQAEVDKHTPPAVQ